MKEVCHDFPVSRSAIQPDTRFDAVMIGMDAHGFEREFTRLEVHKGTGHKDRARIGGEQELWADSDR